MKVIFLDIDGVLNVIPKGFDDFGSVFQEPFVSNFERIIKETGAKIVLSSSWRQSGLQIIQEMWTKRGLPGEVIDVTPGLGCTPATFYNNYLQQHPTPRSFGYSVPRGCEIEYWLANFGKVQRINWSRDVNEEYKNKALVKNYVIIDDDCDMLWHQKEHFVKTSCRFSEKDAVEGYGLTGVATEEVIKILNSDITDLYYPV